MNINPFPTINIQHAHYKYPLFLNKICYFPIRIVVENSGLIGYIKFEAYKGFIGFIIEYILSVITVKKSRFAKTYVRYLHKISIYLLAHKYRHCNLFPWKLLGVKPLIFLFKMFNIVVEKLRDQHRGNLLQDFASLATRT